MTLYVLPAKALALTVIDLLYDGAAKAGDPAVIIYRNYVPNTGTDAAGDVGLPRVTLHMADGTVLQGQDACDILHINYTPPASLYPADDYANLRGSSDPSLNLTLIIL